MSYAKSNEQLTAIREALNINHVPHTVNVYAEHQIIQLGYYTIRKRENKLVAIKTSTYEVIRIEDEKIVAGFQSAFDNAKAIMDEHKERYG